jgi:uncharacterized protein (TIGR00255 family)
MTGFGAGRAEQGGEAVSVEVRAVNGKFCDVKPRLPRELAALEVELTKQVKARVQRGVLDVSVRRESGAAGRGIEPRVDLQLAAAYAKVLRDLRSTLGLKEEPTVSEIAALDGVLQLGEAPPDLAAAAAALQGALSAALDALDAMRLKEGQALAADLSSRIDAVERAIAAVRELSPASVEGYRDRLAARVAELSRGVPLDPARLAQEVALFADRVDVTEELTRLGSHLQQLRALIGTDVPAGRRLEFLLQEVNREVNTIGSKSQHAGIATQVVEIKAELERLREQVANVE